MAAAALLIVEALPAAAPVYRLPARDAVDVALRESRGEGAVAELPVGLRDGFGETGRLDHRALIHQLWHERGIVGGFVARLPSAVREHYLATPILMNLLDLSTPASNGVRLHEHAAREAAALGITSLIINRDTFVDARLPRADLERAGFTLEQTSGPRELYVVRTAERPPQ